MFNKTLIIMIYRNQILTIGGRLFKQANKTQARKAYENKQVIAMHPNNMAIQNSWQTPFVFDESHYSNPHYSDATFDSIVNEFEYYNTGDERGRYAHFFIEFHETFLESIKRHFPTFKFKLSHTTAGKQQLDQLDDFDYFLTITESTRYENRYDIIATGKTRYGGQQCEMDAEPEFILNSLRNLAVLGF